MVRTRSGFELHWSEPIEPGWSGLKVVASATLDRNKAAIRWKLRVENRSKNCTLHRVLFAQLAIPDFDADGAVLFTRGPGEIQQGLWQRDFKWRGNYPSSSCCMQLMAAYRTDKKPSRGLLRDARSLGRYQGFGGEERARGAVGAAYIRHPCSRHGEGWKRLHSERGSCVAASAR